MGRFLLNFTPPAVEFMVIKHEWDKTGGISWTCHACGAHMVVLSMRDGPDALDVIDGQIAVDYLGTTEKTEIMEDCELELVRQVMEG
jgi:hypothetical protein